VIETAEIGPFGMRICSDGSCVPGSLERFGGGILWKRYGMATWGAGLITAVTLLVMAARVAVRRVPRLAAKTVLVATTTATLVGIGFFAKLPVPADIARGIPLFAVAIVLAALAAISVLRVKP
jgi:hypothetical protein